MIEINTLGGNSTFKYDFTGGELYLLFGTLNKRVFVNSSIIEKTKQRVMELSDDLRLSASNYNRNIWSSCPNDRICPYVAKLIIDEILK